MIPGYLKAQQVPGLKMGCGLPPSEPRWLLMWLAWGKHTNGLGFSHYVRENRMVLDVHPTYIRMMSTYGI